MSKKYSICFVFLFLIQLIAAMQVKCSDETKYFDYTNTNKIPKIIIVGSGRGKVSEKNDYAKEVYKERANNYLLVNYEKAERGVGIGTAPDIDCNILDLGSSEQFSKEKYDIIVFENVDYKYSFSRKAIKGALELLKPGGYLVSSTFPTPYYSKNLTPYYSENPNEQKLGNESVKIGDGKLFYQEETAGINSGYVFILWIDDSYPKNKLALSFLNEYKNTIIQTLKISQLVKNIAFMEVSCGSDFWPRKNFDGEKMEVMIIQKKGGEENLDTGLLKYGTYKHNNGMAVDITEPGEYRLGGCCY